MGYAFATLLLLANLVALKCHEEFIQDNVVSSTTNPKYSFSYGVSDVDTGDVKTVWEAREGDTVKGQYSVLEADGSLRTVEYSAGPKTGFTAVVNNDGEKVPKESIGKGRSIEDKALRDYGKYFSAETEEEYTSHDKKKSKHPFDTVFKDYSVKKRPKYPPDLESSDFSHSITIKHPRDESGAESESHTHFGLDLDPNCKNKHKKAPGNNLYGKIVEFDPNKPYDLKFPNFPSDSYRDNFEKYESSNIDYEKYNPFGGKIPKIEPSDYEKLLPYSSDSKIPKFEDFRPSVPLKYNYPFIPDIPSPESYYSDDFPSRPKKKYKPYRHPEFQYPAEEIEDYWVPKKKKKLPPRVRDEYRHESEEEFDRPRYPNDFEDDDEDERPPRTKPRRPGPHKEIVRKIVKKRKPGFNILDILDI